MAQKLKSFLTDEDGLSAIDFLTVTMFFLYVIGKVFNIVIVFVFQNNLEIVNLISDILLDLSIFMESIVKFYFAIKGTSVIASCFLTRKTGKPVIVPDETPNTNINEGGNI